MQENRLGKDSKSNLIKKYTIVLAVSVLFTLMFVILYNSNRKEESLNITESATTDYKVYLNNNSFYKEDYLEANKQYVSSLIKNIAANYSYNLNSNIGKKIDYTYRIDAILDICDTGTKKSLYMYTENLMPEKKLTSDNGKISIKEDVTINYQYFNDIADRFMSTYDLSVANASELKINLFVKTDYTEESTVTLSIPLTRLTFDIGTSNKLSSIQVANVDTTKSSTTTEKVSLIGIGISLLAIVFYTYKLIKTLLDNRTEEAKYKSNVKKILSNYGEYINKTNDFQFNLEEYEIVRVNTFLDLLRIKEDLSRPILMIENKDKTNTVFAITDNSRFIYMYVLNMYRKQLAEKN